MEVSYCKYEHNNIELKNTCTSTNGCQCACVSGVPQGEYPVLSPKDGGHFSHGAAYPWETFGNEARHISFVCLLL